MTLTPKDEACQKEQVSRERFRLGAAAVIVVLVAACRATTGAASLDSPTSLAKPAGAGPSAVASPAVAIGSPTARPTPSSPTPVSALAPAIDPRTDGLDVVCTDRATRLEAAVIRPGRVTLIVRNAGQLTHDFEMKLYHADSGSNSGSGSGHDRQKIETRPFQPAEVLRVEADLAPGVYEIECNSADHASTGMRTSLVVRADAPLVTQAPGTEVPRTVRIVQFAFVPASLDVPAGALVTWTNDDPAPHTITADGGEFDSKQLDPGASFPVVLRTPGTFAYHCEIHLTMVGTIVVH